MTQNLVIDPEALRAARLLAGLSQKNLGLRAGVREATVAAAEQGQRCRPSTIRRLADALEVPPTAIARLVAG